MKFIFFTGMNIGFFISAVITENENFIILAILSLILAFIINVWSDKNG